IVCEVHVEARRVYIPARGVAKMTGCVFLVGSLVLREADVAINAKHGAAIWARVGDKALRDLEKLRCHSGNERAHRRLHAVPEALLVRLEPGALVVSFEFAEENEEVLGEACERIGHRYRPASGGSARIAN